MKNSLGTGDKRLLGFQLEKYDSKGEMVHDHYCDYHVFPLADYVEEIYMQDANKFITRIVKRFKWHHFPARRAHCILGRYNGDDEWTGYDSPQFDDKPIYMIVKLGKEFRRWGIWDRGVWRSSESVLSVKSWIDHA